MSWQDDPRHRFAGIAEKLKRVGESISNLEREIKLFFQDGEYPVLPEPYSEEWPAAVKYHQHRPIPLRFAVLTGEIIHHLRSCLGHAVWALSDDNSRETKDREIEYPIFDSNPEGNKKYKDYEKKIQGIKNPEIRDRIEASQPYHAGDQAKDHPLLILHNLDRSEKHREIVLVSSAANVGIPNSQPALQQRAEESQKHKEPTSEDIDLVNALKVGGLLIEPGIAFGQFGTRERYPLIKGLKELRGEVEPIVNDLAAYVRA